MADSTTSNTSNTKAEKAAEKAEAAHPSADEQAHAAHRAEYDALIADLKTRKHVWNERRPISWAAHDAGIDDAPSRVGKHVVSIQYGPLPTGGGALLRELVFDFAPGEVTAQEEVHDSGL